MPLCLCPEGYGGSPFLDCNPLNSTEVALEAVTDIDTEPFFNADHVTESDFQIDTGNAFVDSDDDASNRTTIVSIERNTQSVRQSNADDVTTENTEQPQHTSPNPLESGENDGVLTSTEYSDGDSNLVTTTTNTSGDETVDDLTPPAIDETHTFVTEDYSYLMQNITTPMPTTTQSNVQKITTEHLRSTSPLSTESNVQKISRFSTTTKPTNVQVIAAKHNNIDHSIVEATTERTNNDTTKDMHSSVRTGMKIESTTLNSTNSVDASLMDNATEANTANTTSASAFQ